MSEGVSVHVEGYGLTLDMPVVPRKGEILALGSLIRARRTGDVQVSRVEWAMDQQSGRVEAWVTVRRWSRQIGERR